MNNRIRFSLVREVIAPKRASEHEAGIDFFVPSDLTLSDLLEANRKVMDISIVNSWPTNGEVSTYGNPISTIELGPHSRIIIPSGVVTLIEPSNSMLMAGNKSGICTKKGLIFGAEIVDSTYTGEIHIHIINTSSEIQVIEAGEKLIQFIHIPIFNTKPEFILYKDFVEYSKNWSKRGDSWQGSSDEVKLKESPYQEGLLDFKD